MKNRNAINFIYDSVKPRNALSRTFFEVSSESGGHMTGQALSGLAGGKACLSFGKGRGVAGVRPSVAAVPSLQSLLLFFRYVMFSRPRCFRSSLPWRPHLFADKRRPRVDSRSGSRLHA